MTCHSNGPSKKATSKAEARKLIKHDEKGIATMPSAPHTVIGSVDGMVIDGFPLTWQEIWATGDYRAAISQFIMTGDPDDYDQMLALVTPGNADITPWDDTPKDTGKRPRIITKWIGSAIGHHWRITYQVDWK